MSILTDASAMLIGDISDDLPAITAAASRDTSHGLDEKPHDGFYDYLTSFKVSFCQISLDILVNISQIESVAEKVEHITFGTETLDQYHYAVHLAEDKGAGKRQAAYNGLLEAELDARTKVVPMLKETLLRFPNLKSVKTEDRPSGLSSINHGEYRTSLGSAKIKSATGVRLSWNGPFSKSPEPEDMMPNIFPTRSRSFVYATVFLLLRELDIIGRRLELDLVIGSYTNADGRSYFTAPFDPSKALPRRIIDKHLRNLEIRDVDTGVWATVHGPNSSLGEFLSKIAFKEVTFNRCIFRGTQLQNAFCGFKGITLRNCTDVRDFGIIVHQHRQTLCSIHLSNVGMPMCKNGTNQWAQFFRALCTMSTIQHVKLDRLRTRLTSGDRSAERAEEDEASIYGVEWNGRKAITAGSQNMAKVVDRLALRKLRAGSLLDLMDGHLVYLAKF